MNQFRDFDNDQNRFGYVEGANFISKLHASGQHYIPIVDSAIYFPNPSNASDAYPPFSRGNATNSFILNPDGSLYSTYIISIKNEEVVELIITSNSWASLAGIYWYALTFDLRFEFANSDQCISLPRLDRGSSEWQWRLRLVEK